MSEPRKTPVFDEHTGLGGRMVEFAGWSMPVQYKGVKEEHLNVRENVGLFDVSHMGEIRIQGPNALSALQWVTSNDASKLVEGKAQYTLLTNEQGGVVDDLIVYCLKEGSDYLLCVNAANTDKDFAWIQEHNQDAEIINESSKWGLLAVHGPKASGLMEMAFSKDVTAIQGFEFCWSEFEGESCLVARTGYTGEDGFEVFVPWQQTAKLWNLLMHKGDEFGIQPAGLGARDTLRTEMRFPLYGQEIDDTTNPYEAGLGWVVKPSAKDFVGKEKIIARKKEGLKQRLVGFELEERGIPRTGYKLFSFDNEEIGKVTSGTVSPSLGKSIGIGYVSPEYRPEGSEFLVEIRKRKSKARVVKTPFIRKG